MRFSAIVPLPAAAQRSAVCTVIAGVPALVRVVQMLADAGADEVVVAAAGSLAQDARDCLTRHEMSVTTVVTDVVTDGGAGRWADCLTAGLAQLRRRSTPPPYVVIHDYRRPLTPVVVCRRVVAALDAGATAVIPAQPFTDSVKTVDTHGSITGTLDRSVLRTAQYPRGFIAARLAELLAGAAADFDELSAALAADLAVTLVDGDPEGFDVDLPAQRGFVAAVTADRRADRS